ncbi:MAG: metallophosphoesterase [Pelosinus sp.]|nr:metallophosphoesterase [Pelosinus sp.]
MTMYEDSLTLLQKRQKYVNPYDYNIVFFGDSWVGDKGYTSNDIFQSALEAARKYNPLFILHGGDIVHNGAKENFDFFINFKNKYEPDLPLFVAVGNHEMELINPLDKSQSIENFEQMIGPVHFAVNIPEYNLKIISLNTLDQYIYGQYGLRNAELTFLRENLKQHCQSTFVTMHVPPKTDKWQDPEEFFTIGSELLFSEIKDKTAGVLASHVHAFKTTKYQHSRVFVSGGGGATLLQKEIFHIMVINIKSHGKKSKVSFEVIPIGRS